MPLFNGALDRYLESGHEPGPECVCGQPIEPDWNLCPMCGRDLRIREREEVDPVDGVDK